MNRSTNERKQIFMTDIEVLQSHDKIGLRSSQATPSTNMNNFNITTEKVNIIENPVYINNGARKIKKTADESNQDSPVQKLASQKLRAAVAYFGPQRSPSKKHQLKSATPAKHHRPSAAIAGSTDDKNLAPHFESFLASK